MCFHGYSVSKKDRKLLVLELLFYGFENDVYNYCHKGRLIGIIGQDETYTLV